jgi:predicted nucleic acid-binding protein
VIAIVDASALVEAAYSRTPSHDAVVATLMRHDLTLIVPALVVAEASYLIGSRVGAVTEARFLAGMADFEVEVPHREDWARISELVYQYRDFPLGGTDAATIALAERLETNLVITLDRRHFAAVRPRHVPTFRILPD